MPKPLSSWAASTLLKLSRLQFAENRGIRFLKLAAEARANISEVTATDAVELIKDGALAIDVREPEEFRRGHIPYAENISRGILEIRIESREPNVHARIICYCGAGNRSALAAESLQRIGYRNVRVISGGLQSWLDVGLPVTRKHSEMED